jgi:hypothetical protein
MDVVTGLDPGTIIAFFALALSASLAYGVWARRTSATKREDQRSEDQLNGWIDGRGRWQPGIIDEWRGWVDDNGNRHPGLPSRVESLEEFRRLHEQTTHGGSPP